MKNIHIAWREIVQYGLVLSILFTIIVLGSYRIEPLMWASDFPEEVQQKIGEIPEEVIPLGWGVFLLIVTCSIVFPVVMNRKIFKQQSEKATFLNLLLNAFLLLNFMNLWDAIVVDVLIFDLMKPDFMMIKGAEEYIETYVNAQFHFTAFFKGLPYLLVVAVISVGIYKLIFRRKSQKIVEEERQ